MHHEFVKRASEHVDRNPKKLTPAVQEFADLIEGNSRVYMYFTQMFDEIPRREPYFRDPTGTKQIRDYHHMLQVLNHIVTRAPGWTDAAESVGMVGVPMCAVFDYVMATPRYAKNVQNPQKTSENACGERDTEMC